MGAAGVEEGAGHPAQPKVATTRAVLKNGMKAMVLLQYLVENDPEGPAPFEYRCVIPKIYTLPRLHNCARLQCGLAPALGRNGPLHRDITATFKLPKPNCLLLCLLPASANTSHQHKRARTCHEVSRETRKSRWKHSIRLGRAPLRPERTPKWFARPQPADNKLLPQDGQGSITIRCFFGLCGAPRRSGQRCLLQVPHEGASRTNAPLTSLKHHTCSVSFLRATCVVCLLMGGERKDVRFLKIFSGIICSTSRACICSPPAPIH